jgi:proteic killer suppression protein
LTYYARRIIDDRPHGFRRVFKRSNYFIIYGRLYMIKSLGNSATYHFLYGGKSKFNGLDERVARLRLNELNDASALTDLKCLNSVGLHKLKGPLKQFWSIDVNGPWRIIFKFNKGNAYEVEIVDPH